MLGLISEQTETNYYVTFKRGGGFRDILRGVKNFRNRPLSLGKFPKPEIPMTSLITNVVNNIDNEDKLTIFSDTDHMYNNKDVNKDNTKVEVDDDDDDELYTKLINAVHERHPLWDYRLPSNRNQSIKDKLWNEIYNELNC